MSRAAQRPARAAWTHNLIKICRHCGHKESFWSGNHWCPKCERGLDFTWLEPPRKPMKLRVRHPFPAFERWARQ